MDGFVLGGGTALSEFYLGHRLSEDLDLFSNEPGLVRSVGPLTAQVLQEKLQHVEVIVSGSHPLQWRFEILSTETDETVRLDVANAEPPHTQSSSEVGAVAVAGFEDLILGKLVALTERTEAKDLIDLWTANEQAGLNLEELETLLAARDPRFLLSPHRLGRAFEEAARKATSLALPTMLIDIDMNNVRKFFETEAKAAMKRLLERDT